MIWELYDDTQGPDYFKALCYEKTGMTEQDFIYHIDAGFFNDSDDPIIQELIKSLDFLRYKL